MVFVTFTMAVQKDFVSMAFPFRTYASVASSSAADKLAVTFTLSIIIASFATEPSPTSSVGSSDC